MASPRHRQAAAPAQPRTSVDGGRQVVRGESGFSRSHSARARAPAPRLAERTASGADAAAESKVQSLREFVQARGNRSILRVFQTQDMNHSGKIELPGAPPRILSPPASQPRRPRAWKRQPPTSATTTSPARSRARSQPRHATRSLATLTRHTLSHTHLPLPLPRAATHTALLRAEFRNALLMMGLDIPQSDSAAIFRFFDRDGSGVLELGELITELKGAARSETTRRAHIGNTAIPLLEASHGAARAHEQARAGVLKNEARRGGFAGAESYNGTPENRRVPRRPTPRSEVVLEVLRNFFRQRSFRALLGAFRAQDHDRSGRFELPEFALALKALNLDLEDDDIAAVFASLDADGSGVLELSEFMNAMLAEPSADEARWLRLGIGKQQLQPAQGVPSIQKTRHEETSFTRELADSHSVTRGRARPVSAPVGRAALRASTGLPTGRPVETVMHLLRNYFGARPNTALVGAFREQDQDRSGRFSVLEFKAALRALNVDVTEGEAEDVFRHLDADGSGVLELSEFVNAMKAEAPPEETRWLRFGVGHHYVAPNPEPPAIEAVQANASGIGGYNRSTRQHVKAHSLGMPARVPRRRHRSCSRSCATSSDSGRSARSSAPFVHKTTTVPVGSSCPSSRRRSRRLTSP